MEVGRQTLITDENINKIKLHRYIVNNSAVNNMNKDFSKLVKGNQSFNLHGIPFGTPLGDTSRSIRQGKVLHLYTLYNIPRIDFGTEDCDIVLYDIEREALKYIEMGYSVPEELAKLLLDTKDEREQNRKNKIDKKYL